MCVSLTCNHLNDQHIFYGNNESENIIKITMTPKNFQCDWQLIGNVYLSISFELSHQTMILLLEMFLWSTITV